MEPIIKWEVFEGTSFAGTVHPKTLIMTWIVLAILVVFVLMGTRKLTSGKPGKFQNLLEWIVDFIKGLVADNMSYKQVTGLLSYLVTLIMFVFFSNMMGLIPNFLEPVFKNIHFAGLNEMFGHATLQSPTADVNVTIGLALLTLILIFVMGIRAKKGKFFKHFLEPYPPFLIMHIIDYAAKPLTMAFRLFGNIYAGEVLILVILMLPQNLGLVGIAGALPMAIWLIFSILIGAIQSFVFTVLTIVFVGQVVSDEH